MKECPVCHALAFDDSKKCYGCLYDFNESDSIDTANPSINEDERDYQEINEDRKTISDPFFDKVMPVEIALRLYPHIDSTGVITWSFSCNQQSVAEIAKDH